MGEVRMSGGTFAVRLAVAGAGCIVLGVVLPSVAQAAFPGSNGDIAFVSTRNNATAVYQVNPEASGVGTVSGDNAATTSFTDGGGLGLDAEPFYSPDGATVYFSSNRTGDWVIYSLVQTSSEPPATPTMLSQSSGGTFDDYAPSVAPDGTTVVFNRGNGALYTLDATVGPASVCLLDTPPTGLSPAGTDGADSRAAFDPQDATKLIYIGGDNHLHLLSGLPSPLSSGRCSPGTLSDTDLSVAANPGTYRGIAGAADANPDWSPDGTKVIFDSTRGGGHTLWLMTSPFAPSPSIAPLWPALAGPGKTSDTQPAFSPDGAYITYTQPRPGTQVVDYELNKLGNANSSGTDLTLGYGTSQNSQPDWQPVLVAQTPEIAMPVLLPAAGVFVAGLTFLGLRRRRTAGSNSRPMGGQTSGTRSNMPSPEVPWARVWRN